MKIELLYLMDCPYCLKTKKILRDVVKDLGLDAEVEEILIDSDAKAKKHKFVGSPTVRINGKDIQETVTKDLCKPCSGMTDACTTCRTYMFKGKTYNYPPKEMIKKFIKETM